MVAPEELSCEDVALLASGHERVRVVRWLRLVQAGAAAIDGDRLVATEPRDALDPLGEALHEHLREEGGLPLQEVVSEPLQREGAHESRLLRAGLLMPAWRARLVMPFVAGPVAIGLYLGRDAVGLTADGVVATTLLLALCVGIVLVTNWYLPRRSWRGWRTTSRLRRALREGRLRGELGGPIGRLALCGPRSLRTWFPALASELASRESFALWSLRNFRATSGYVEDDEAL